MSTDASSKQLTVFGANGKVGKQVVTELLTRGYHVAAFVHRHHDFAPNPQLTIMRGDIYNPADVQRAVKGSDAVISVLGSWGTPQKDVLSAGMANIVPAMQAAGITRIISLTGADARAPGDELSLIHKVAHAILTIVAAKVIGDGEKHILLLKSSGLEWTVLRSPPMLGGNKHTYRLSSSRPLPWIFVRRRAVAQAMVDMIGVNEHVASAPYIRNG